MKTAARILGTVWLAPIALPIWLLYLLPFWALGWHAFVGWDSPMVARFAVSVRAPRWLQLRWDRWAGHAMPFAVVFARFAVPDRVLAHELRHTDQWLVLGPLFPLVYGVLLLTHGYANHPLERDADRYARLSIGG
jgi:hypothetical protein